MTPTLKYIACCGAFFFLFLLPGLAAAATAPIAVFPLRELSKGSSNEVNLPITRALAEGLAAIGNEVSRQESVLAFMANNRIRTVGHLETYHISRVREELGVGFVLLGTISQLKNRPMPVMGVTLQLVRTSDARTVWSYVGHFSAGDERRILGIGEPSTMDEMRPLLLKDVAARWPWDAVRELQQITTVSIDSIMLQPTHVRPGGEVRARVRIRNEWSPGRVPKVFFQADEQIYPATVSGDNRTYEASWVAGNKDGRFPVTLLVEWTMYGRSETVPLGVYLVDGTPPLLEMEFKGTQIQGEVPVFRKQLVIVPRMLVRKPIARWRLSFQDEYGETVGADEEHGNLPEAFIWRGQGAGGMVRDGEYKISIEAWDKAGNSGKATGFATLSRTAPEVALAVERSNGGVKVGLTHDGKVPLAFWRMEMWSSEGRIISSAEGRELPKNLDIALREGDEGGDGIQGFLFVEDVLGNRARRDVQEFFLTALKKPGKEEKKEKAAPLSESWVDEF